VGCRVVFRQGVIESLADDRSVLHNDCPEGLGPRSRESLSGEVESPLHELVFVHLRKLAPTLDVNCECCAGIATTKNLGVFEARSYEGTYLTGIAAGKMTKTNVLGWVGAFPVPQVLYNLNGFLLGARSVNPNAVCKVVWANAWSDPAKENDAVNADPDVVRARGGDEAGDGADEHHALDAEVQHTGLLRDQLAERRVNERRAGDERRNDDRDDHAAGHRALSGNVRGRATTTRKFISTSVARRKNSSAP
jgi:hypothetical protein